MAARFRTWHFANIASSLVALATGMLADPLLAQVCTPTLPSPQHNAGSDKPDGHGKFRLIEQACPDLRPTVIPRHAAQLDLYERQSTAASVADLGNTASRKDDVSARPARTDKATARVISLAPAMIAVAQENGLNPLLLHAIAHVESRHDPSAVSPAGALGLMQVMPATARRFGVGNESALHDADTNLRASAAYLRTLMLRYRDDLSLVLAAYNAGESAVDRAGGKIPRYPETQKYVRDVIATFRSLSERFTVAGSGQLQRIGSTAGAGR